MKYKTILLILSIGFHSNSYSSEWIAPENPKPKKILSEAREDFKNQHYEESLLKYIWIHEHSLEYRYSFFGVRNSYALDEWYKLGTNYPLARDKFHEHREKAKQQVKSNKNLLLNFIDFQAFNRILGKQDKTIELFLWVEKNVPFMADAAFVVAKNDLFILGRYNILNKYI